MATELDRRCPICLDTMDDASYVMPCLHQFCFGCIQRWAESRPTCPLCKCRKGSEVVKDLEHKSHGEWLNWDCSV
uniref:RING-type E3 ubiquitin transferase n=1 Tax=Meleagris gallopavo TaxID=9103 RepID=A0A803YLZ7_MELGA